MKGLKWALPLALAAMPGLARSELRICNETGARHAVAIGYESAGTWVSEGWWTLEPGSCATPLKGDLKDRYYYYRAQAGGRRFLDQNYGFCTRRAAFTIKGDADCAARGYDRALFRRIDTGGTAASFTLRFAAGVSPRLAGRSGDPPGAAPEAAGAWGEPYVSDTALFQGCASGAEPPFCSFHSGGTKFFVYDDGRTPPGIFRAMQTYRPGTPIELSGDLEAIHERTADIVLRRVLPRHWTERDDTLEKLQGRWYSVDDPKARIDIVGSELENIYDGARGAREYLVVRASCDGFRAGDYLVRRQEETGAALCYSIESLDRRSMTLIDLPGGDVHKYRRLD